MENVTTVTSSDFDVIRNAMEMPTLEEMNSAEVERLIPTIVFLLIICVVGIIGNCLVIHVYRTRYKMSNSKCFILCLSAVDLLTCCLAIPLEISTVLHQYTFEHLWLCKMSRVFNTLGTTSSSFILLFIAVDRFRKVCKPFGWQIKTKVTKILCGLAILIGVFVSTPAIFIYGKHTFDIPEFNLTGTECSTADDMVNTRFPFFYAIVFGIMFVAGIIAMSVLYCFIGNKVRKHSRKMKVVQRNMSIPMTSSIINDRDSKVDGEIDAAVLAKYEMANNKNENMYRTKKRNTKRKKSETDDSWTEKKDLELSYTFSQQSNGKEKNRENSDNLENVDNNFVERRSADKSDSEDSGIKVKDEKETSNKNTNDDKNTSQKYKDSTEKSFQGQEEKEVKTEVSPTSSEEILPKEKGVLRRISSISSRISNVIIMRVTSIASARANSDAGTLKRTQFLKQARARKTAFLMFIITLGFILSFLPHLLLMLLRQIKSDFVDNLSDTNTAVYKFFLRSYFLNSAINPIIYSICDSRFKSACKQIFGKLCR